MKSIEAQIGATLAREEGMGGFVCIWRKSGDPLDDGADNARTCPRVSEWKKEGDEK